MTDFDKQFDEARDAKAEKEIPLPLNPALDPLQLAARKDFSNGANWCREPLKVAAEALTDLIAMIDEGELVRDISKDHESDYHLRMVKLVSRLQRNGEALTTIEKFLEGKK